MFKIAKEKNIINMFYVYLFTYLIETLPKETYKIYIGVEWIYHSL